jgi:2-deoxy-D-gluconate 3-dehydrogenase
METELTRALREDDERYDALLARMPSARWGTPADLAGAVVYLASEASGYVSGGFIAVDGGYLAR